MEVKASLQQHYPDLGHCLYFDIAENTHAVLYELTGNRLNWLWYINQPEPNLKVLTMLFKVFQADGSSNVYYASCVGFVRNS